MHHPNGPNFLLSITIECKKQTVNIRDLQFEWSTLSKNSWVMIVVNVLYRPAFKPLGGSFVTLMVFCSNPSGNLGCYSQVIHNLKSS